MFNDLYKKAEAVTRRCECLHCAVGSGLFESESKKVPVAIRSHSISRSNTLSLIEESGSVYAPKASTRVLVGSGEDRYEIGEISSKKSASIFHGYCEDHDRELFLALDRGDFSLSIDICNIAALRSLAHEIVNYCWRQRAIKHCINNLVGDKIVSVRDGIEMRKRSKIASSEIRLGGMLAEYKLLKDHIVNGVSGDLSHIVFAFDKALPIQSCGAAMARNTPLGREVFSYHEGRYRAGVKKSLLVASQPLVIISTISNGTCLYIVITLSPSRLSASDWLDYFIEDSLLGDNLSIKYQLLSWCVRTTKTTFWRPSAYMSLSEEQRSLILSIADNGAHSQPYPDQLERYSFLKELPGELLAYEVLNHGK